MVNAINAKGFFGVYATWLGQFGSQYPGRVNIQGVAASPLGNSVTFSATTVTANAGLPPTSTIPRLTLSGQPGFTGSTTGYVLHLVNPFNPVLSPSGVDSFEIYDGTQDIVFDFNGAARPGHVNIPYTSGESRINSLRPSWRQSTLRGCSAFMPRGWGNSATSISARSISKAWRPVPAATR